MALYYAYKFDGHVSRIAKQEPWGVFWGWENGQWVEMPSLCKVTYEITDYEDITEEEAMRLIELKESGRANKEEVK